MIRHCALFILTGFLCACAVIEEPIDTSTAEGSYRLARLFEKDERYEESIAYYNTVKNKYPYSRYALDSELRIAEIQYKRESYLEAEAAYRLFKEFHPKYPKIDYVTFRLAMSIYKQLPDTIDRDLSLSKKAILFFNEIIRSYPNSDYVGSSRDHKRKILKMLGQKELYVANFYFKQEHFDSALNRYEFMLANFPGLGLNSEALKGATLSAIKTKDKNKARLYFERLKTYHSDSKELRELRKEYGDEL